MAGLLRLLARRRRSRRWLPAGARARRPTACAAWAQGPVDVQQPWVRATVAQQKATGAFMQLKAAEAMRLVEARRPAAGVVEIHEMTMADQVMKMRAIPGLDLPAGRSVELKPGGHHVMPMDLKAPIKAGDNVPLTLVFEDVRRQRHAVEVRATARELAGSGKPMTDHGK